MIVCWGLLSIARKSKDIEKVILDLLDMNIRKELHLYKVGNKWKKPHASYTLVWMRGVNSVNSSNQ